MVEDIAAPKTARTANIAPVALILNHMTVSDNDGQKRRKKNMVPW
jgi:uncharacterized membrane protein YadS